MKRRFLLGFVGGFLAFLLINLLVAHLLSDCGLPAVFGRDFCADDIARAGWPIQFYEEGGLAYRHTFDPISLILNLVIGLGFSMFSGWFFAHPKRPLLK